MISARRALFGAFAALLAVAASTAHAANGNVAAARSRLAAELPGGVTLAKASVDQTAGAVRSAVSKDTADATDILRAAILSKEPKQGQGKLSCADVSKLTRAAVASDSASASQLVDTASSLHPECADSLNSLLNNPTAGDTSATTGLYGPAEEFGFGIGFGPGFPGSPGFVGSAPSGAFALPPVTVLPTPSPTPVTPTSNT